MKYLKLEQQIAPSTPKCSLLGKTA